MTHFKEHEDNQRANCSPESETEWSIDSVAGVRAPRLKLTSPLPPFHMIVILPGLQISGIQVQLGNISALRSKVGLGRTKRAAVEACGELRVLK
jgi:hypothetical protein